MHMPHNYEVAILSKFIRPVIYGHIRHHMRGCDLCQDFHYNYFDCEEKDVFVIQ